MNILLYSPDNGVTRNFMPHLWMFLLKALTPAGHEVFLIDGNAQPMTEAQVADFVRANFSDLGVNYVIHAQQIWSVDRSSEGWRFMEDRGSVTANHYDHVHVTTY